MPLMRCVVITVKHEYSVCISQFLNEHFHFCEFSFADLVILVLGVACSYRGFLSPLDLDK